MVARTISGTGLRLVFFAVFLALLTVIPRFCTPGLDSERTVVEPGVMPVAAATSNPASPDATPTRDTKRFTREDRKIIEEEAGRLEWQICSEEKPSADECRITRVVVVSSSVNWARVKIEIEYWYANWQSDRSKHLYVQREFERFAGRWIPSQ